MNFQDDISSFPFDNFEGQYVLVFVVFDLNSINDVSETCLDPELVREPLKLELHFSFSPEHLTELIVLGATNVFGCI